MSTETKLDVLQCRVCGAFDPGPREFCSSCGSGAFSRYAVSGQGRLVSWTVIRRAPSRFRGDAPYVVAVVDLGEGIRLTGRLTGDTEDLAPGASVEFVGKTDSVP